VREARCTGRAEAFDVMISGPIFRVQAHFCAILGVDPAERTGKS
jgi:hypothetical protein